MAMRLGDPCRLRQFNGLAGACLLCNERRLSLLPQVSVTFAGVRFGANHETGGIGVLLVWSDFGR